MPHAKSACAAAPPREGITQALPCSYDPTSGRRLGGDPLGFDAGDGNLYRYVRNSPGRSVDPFGTAAPSLRRPPAFLWYKNKWRKVNRERLFTVRMGKSCYAIWIRYELEERWITRKNK